MSRLDRRNAIIAAVILAVGTIAAALVTRGAKREPLRTEPAKIENKADTKGDQSPAISEAGKDVTITYGQEPRKSKPKNAK